MKKISSNWIFLGVVFIVMCVLNFMTPISVQDDMDYKFMFGESQPHLVQSIGDVFVSQWHHWLIQNGRTIPHILLQTFNGVLGKGLFNFFNAGMFCLLFMLISKYGTGKVKWTWMSISLALFLLFCPIIGETVMWFTGSFNYLWTLVFALTFLLVFQKEAEEPISPKSYWIGFAAIFLAWTNEGAVIPVCFGLGIYFLANIRKVWHQTSLLLIIGWLIGTALLVFAPGVFARVSTHGAESASLMGRIITVVVTMLQLRLFWIFSALALFTWWKYKDIFRQFTRSHYIIVVTVYSSIIVYFISNCHYPRVRFATEVFALVALIALLNMLLNERTVRLTAMSSAAFSIVFALPIVYYSNINYGNWKEIEAQLKTPGCLIVQTPEDRIPAFYDNYMMKHMDFCKPRVWYFGCTNKKYVATYYNKPTVQYIPKTLYQDISANPAKYQHFATTDGCRLVAIKMEPSSAVKGVQYCLKPISLEAVPFYIRPIRNKINRYSTTSDVARSYDFIKIKGQSYLVATLPIMKDMRDRVEGINVIE